MKWGCGMGENSSGWNYPANPQEGDMLPSKWKWSQRDEIATPNFSEYDVLMCFPSGKWEKGRNCKAWPHGFFFWDGRLDLGMLGNLLPEYALCAYVYSYLTASVDVSKGLKGFCVVSFDWLVAFSWMGGNTCLVLFALRCLGSCCAVSADLVRGRILATRAPRSLSVAHGPGEPAEQVFWPTVLVTVQKRTCGTCALKLLLITWLSLL